MLWKTGILLLCWVALAAAVGCRSDASAPDAAPDFALQDVNPASATYGKTLRLSTLWGGEGVVVNFMASWCMPCRMELPSLQAIHATGDARIVCVAADEGAGTGDLLAMVAEAGLTLPVLYAPPAEAAELAGTYTHDVLPSTYLIGRDGRILELISGARPESVFREAISSMLPSPAARRR